VNAEFRATAQLVHQAIDELPPCLITTVCRKPEIERGLEGRPQGTGWKGWRLGQTSRVSPLQQSNTQPHRLRRVQAPSGWLPTQQANGSGELAPRIGRTLAECSCPNWQSQGLSSSNAA
jgi:hypothetical protein